MTAGTYSLIASKDTLAGFRDSPRTVHILVLGTNVLAGPLRLPFKGIAVVNGLRTEWNAAALTVDLAWQPVDTALIPGYNIYRAGFRLGDP